MAFCTNTGCLAEKDVKLQIIAFYGSSRCSVDVNDSTDGSLHLASRVGIDFKVETHLAAGQSTFLDRYMFLTES